MPRTGLTSDQLRDKAIEYTLVRMRQCGFEKVRLSDIAKDLGVSHAALYSHFADKSALLDAVSERWLNQLDAAQAKLIEDGESAGDSPLKTIEVWFLSLHQAKREKVMADPELFRAFNYSAQAEKPFIKKHLKNMHDQLEHLVSRAIVDKKISGIEAAAAVDFLFEATNSFCHPALVVQYYEQERSPALSHLLAVLFRGLA